MSRSGITALLTALEGTDVQPFYAVEFELDTAPIRLWTCLLYTSDAADE